MSKAVLISIKPEWCDLIASGEKTIEVRKTRPRLETPFKCYIYCTIGKYHARSNRPEYALFLGDGKECANGKVIGEFVCDEIFQYSTADVEGIEISDEEMQKQSCLTAKELHDYEYSVEPKELCIYLIGLYGWHISDLVVYDKPKSLREFNKELPPQSWCYVEELQ